MLSPTHLYTEAQKRLNELYKIRTMLEKESTTRLEGNLHIVCSEKRIQYYIRTDPKDKSGKYLRKSETTKIKQYLQKKYNERVFMIISKEIKGIEKLLYLNGSAVEEIREIYSDNHREINMNIDPIDISDDDYKNEWISREYNCKKIPDGAPIYTSDKGDRVRSKSELNIANMLFKKNIPYKYECPLVLSSGMTIYPDFTVLNICDRKEIYWEHRGMMGDEKYANHSVYRLKQYSKENIFLGDNLIITEETLENPLGTDEIERIINHYFFKMK